MNLVKFLQTAIVTDRTLQNEFTNYYFVFDSIDQAIQYAWNNWEDSLLCAYYPINTEKPREAPRDFQLAWIKNEDFEADGFDVNAMIKDFGVTKY